MPTSRSRRAARPIRRDTTAVPDGFDEDDYCSECGNALDTRLWGGLCSPCADDAHAQLDTELAEAAAHAESA